MKTKFLDSFMGGYILGILAMVLSFGLILATVDEGPGYKEGQIDALTGVVKYELVENPDQTREWKRKE